MGRANEWSRQRTEIASEEILAAFHSRLKDLGISMEEAGAVVNDAEDKVGWMIEAGIEGDEIVNRMIEMVNEDLEAFTASAAPAAKVEAFSGGPSQDAIPDAISTRYQNLATNAT